MRLPNNSEAFKSIVLGKVRVYCDTKIWPFEYDAFTGWLGNFDCRLEEYVALQLIDSLIVRSNDMAKASYSKLLNCELLQYLTENSLIDNMSISKWKRHLTNGTLNMDVRFAPVRMKNDEGESGSVIFRMMSSELDTNRYSYAMARGATKILILVDDFLGSGDQFKLFADEFDLINKLGSMSIIYCPLIGFEDGINVISEEFPSLKIIPAEIVRSENSVFFGEDKALFKNDQHNTIGDVKAFWDEMHLKYAPGMPNWFGYNKAALPLSFQWGCPNQSPSIFYLKHSKHVPNWKRLFGRRS